MTALLPFRICACGAGNCEGCNGGVIFAESRHAALLACAKMTEEPEYALPYPSPESEPLRVLWKGEPLSPGRPFAEEARLWRLAGWGEVDGWSCHECGLKPWEGVPESEPSQPDDPEFCLECDPPTPAPGVPSE